MNGSGNFKSLLIGIFALVAMGLLMWSILWVRPTIGDERQVIYARFTNIDKVSVGTRVLFAGEPVGEVSQIEEIRDARVDTVNGKVYIFQLQLKIDSNVDVYMTDLISIKTSGLLGEKAVDITPLPPQPGKAFERVTRDDILYANSAGSVEDAFSQIGKLSSKVEKVVDQLGDVFSQLDQGKFWDNLSSSAKHMDSVTSSLDKPEELKQTIDNFHEFSKDLKASWKKVDPAVENLAKAAETFMDLSVLAKDIFKNIEEGKGSIGSLLKKDDFYLQIKAIMSKVETLMDDINHYGILYQTDKRWQRQRERKVNYIAQLKNPQQFRNYFTDEVNEIQTGIARVAAVITEAEEKCCSFDGCFEKVFGDLLRRLSNLESLVIRLNDELKEDSCNPCNSCATGECN